MSAEDFKTKYPYIKFTVARNFTLGDDARRLAEQNFKSLFETLPEEQRVILNRLGLEVRWCDQNEALKEERGILHKTLNSGLPASAVFLLDSGLFSHPDNPSHDWQRYARYALAEEAAHTVSARLHDLNWIRIVSEDWANNGQKPDFLRLHDAHRTYSTPPDGGMQMVKKPLSGYIADAKAEGRGDLHPLTVLAAEWVPEIIHSRDFLRAAGAYGGKGTFNRPAQHALDHYFDRMRSFKHANPMTSDEDYIDHRLRRQFPYTYPFFLDYEHRLAKLAQEIKTDPASFPVPNQMGISDRFKGAGKWNEPFKGLFGGRER